MERKENISCLNQAEKSIQIDSSRTVIYPNDVINTRVSNKAKCPDCDLDIDLPSDVQTGEIYSCSGCGLELEFKGYKQGKPDLQELTIDGEDWGE